MDFSNQTVLCIGDVMLDRFAFSDMERISPEAPVPVLRLKHTQEMLGGAGNVANNVASLGGNAILVGMAGRNAAGTAIRRILKDSPRIISALVGTINRPAICKTRFIAGNQHVGRTDDESLGPLTPQEAAGLMNSVCPKLLQAHAVVLSDYGKGTL